MNTENQIVNEQASESKFNFKMDELMEVAKKKKSILEYHEINDFFKDMELDAEHFERILEKLESAASAGAMTLSATRRSSDVWIAR